jgi:protein ImuB
MAFAAVYVPNFMVQTIARAEPGLRGRAVALVDGCPPLSKIVAANEAALQAGIELGMGGSQAAQFGKVEIRQRSPEQEKAAHEALLDAGWSMSPRIEDTAPDTIVLDIAGLTSLFKSVENIAALLAEHSFRVGLHPNIAVASGIETAIHAARGFAGITLIPQGEETERLSPLPVEVLSPSAEILETLQEWGIRTCGLLAALPLLQLSERLGQEGVFLHQLAQGKHCRSLLLAQPETCFTEEMALEYAVTELEPLSFLLGRLLDQVCARLEARSLAASAFCLRFGLKDSVEEESQVKGQPSVSTMEPGTYEKMLRLPVPMRDSKTLLKLLRLQLQSDPPHGSIVKIILTAESARPRAGQKGLFIPDSPDAEKLEVTIARIAGLVGNANVGSPQLLDTHRPGEFKMFPFSPVSEESGAPAKSGVAKTKSVRNGRDKSKSRRVVIAFRKLRPELLADVELREGSPSRVRFLGACGNVIAASGPWRTSGDWWEEHGWQEDEWDVEIHFDSSGRKQNSHARAQDGIYRIYFDWLRRGWFVRGRYD